VTLTLSWLGWNMGSAQRLDRLNIWLKFHDIHSRGSEDINQTRNTWFKSSNTTGDRDLELARLEHGFCTSSWWAEHFTKVSRYSFQGFIRYEPDTKYMVQIFKHHWWPWPWAGQDGTWVLHVVLMGKTFDIHEIPCRSWKVIDQTRNVHAHMNSL
jgi:hypothetical protein